MEIHKTREKLEEKRRKIHKKEICMFSKLKREKHILDSVSV